MKSWPITTCVFPVLLAAFLAAQGSPLRASDKDVAGIHILVKNKSGPSPAQVATFGNGTFSVQLDGAGTYQVTAVGVRNLKTGTSVKLSFSVRAAITKSAVTPKPAAPVEKTAIAVLDASGGLAFPGDIQVSEASVLTGRLEIDRLPIPAKDPLPPVEKRDEGAVGAPAESGAKIAGVVTVTRRCVGGGPGPPKGMKPPTRPHDVTVALDPETFAAHLKGAGGGLVFHFYAIRGKVRGAETKFTAAGPSTNANPGFDVGPYSAAQKSETLAYELVITDLNGGHESKTYPFTLATCPPIP